MTLIEKLEAKRREFDRRVQESLPHRYDQHAADMRDLLDQVKIRLEMFDTTARAWAAMRRRYHEETFVND